MFEIQDLQLFALSDENPGLMSFWDIGESFLNIQLGRIVSRPLVTSIPKRRNFSSWKGRFVCAIKLGQTLFREPFRFIKNIVVVAILSMVVFLNLLNFPFSKISREAFVDGVVADLSSLGGLFVRPFVFALDLIKLSAGALIDPKFAIFLNADVI